MKKNKNSFGLGVVLGAGLLVATHASAYSLKLGDWDVQVDGVSSVGLSVRTEDRDAVYLPAGNGGPQDETVGLDAVFLASAASAAAGGPAIPGASSRLCGTLDNPSAFAQSLGSVCMYDTLAGRYLGLAMKAGRPVNQVDEGLDYLTEDYFTPANVRRLGR